MPAALIASASPPVEQIDRETVGREAQELAGEGVTVEEALRQLFLLGEAVESAVPAIDGSLLVRSLGGAAEAIAAGYVTTAEEVAGTDALTSLPNRRALEDALEGAVKRVSSGDGSVAIAILDLDGLKVANDDFGGHLAGDHYLRRFGSQLVQAVRSFHGRAYLWHGDEFCVLFRDTAYDTAEQVLSELRARPDVAPFSFGIVVCPDDGVDSRQLMEIADEERLYAMKNERSKEERAEAAREWLRSEYWDYQTGHEED